MGRTYERSGKPNLPRWWTDLVFPKLEQVDYAELAAAASAFAGRASPWKRDAITKFKTGAARTRELANGISLALGIPQPYFEARSEKESQAMRAVMELGNPPSEVSKDQDAKLAALDVAGDRERRAAIDQTRRVPSADEGTSRRGRARRTTRGRA